MNNHIRDEHFYYKWGGKENKNPKSENTQKILNMWGVFLVTYQTSKGMEFDDVYLLDCQKILLQSPADKNKFYVAVTRARETLTFVFNLDDQSSPVLDVIKDNKECFDIEEVFDIVDIEEVFGYRGSL